MININKITIIGFIFKSGLLRVDLLESLLDLDLADVHHLEGNKRHGEAGEVLDPPGHKVDNTTQNSLAWDRHTPSLPGGALLVGPRELNS